MDIMKKIGKHIFWILQLVISLIMIVNIYGFLPMKYLAVIVIILGLLLAFTAFMQISNRTNTIVKVASKVLSVLLCILIVFANFKIIDKVHETINKIGNNDIKTTKVSVIVKSDSTYKKIEDLDGQKFGLLKEIDREHTNFMLNQLSDKFKNEINKTEYKDSKQMLTDLLEGRTDAIIMNEGFRDSFNLIDTKFESETRVIYSLDKEEVVKNTKTAAVTKESFVVYISGIDTTGPISTTSRSDVNMLMVVNPIKKKVALVSIPRDYYVPLQCPNGACETGAMDKLTHSGLYGIETSQETISKLLGVDINYNVRINFDTLTTMVDALGGVDIYSDQNLNLLHGSGCNIKVGTNHVDGKCALGFSRERYSYTEGDRHRVQNQQEVVTAMINKLTGTNIIKNYESLLNAVQGMFQTNMSTNDITALIQMQINDMAKWDIKSMNVDGTGDMVATYSYGATPLYVMRPDTSTITEAKQIIKSTME